MEIKNCVHSCNFPDLKEILKKSEISVGFLGDYYISHKTYSGCIKLDEIPPIVFSKSRYTCELSLSERKVVLMCIEELRRLYAVGDFQNTAFNVAQAILTAPIRFIVNMLKFLGGPPVRLFVDESIFWRDFSSEYTLRQFQRLFPEIKLEELPDVPGACHGEFVCKQYGDARIGIRYKYNWQTRKNEGIDCITYSEPTKDAQPAIYYVWGCNTYDRYPNQAVQA